MGNTDATEKLGKSWFRNFAGEMWANITPHLPSLVTGIFKEVQKATPTPSATKWATFLDGLANEKPPRIPQDTANLLKKLSSEDFPISFIAMLMARMKIFSSEINTMVDVYGLDRQYKAMESTTPHPAPVAELVRAMILDPKRTTENRQQLKKHGYDNTQIDNIVLAYYKTIDEGTLRVLYLRKIITAEKLYERMYELGYTKARIDDIVQTWEIIPGPGDLFNMVAKEAFEPDIVAKLGLGAEFPTEQLPWLQKQGISEYWAMKYWIAHWAQPSIGQGFEMLHRGVINDAELDLLFRAVEVPSFWRDKLTQVAYVPYTRVDARRMADVGVLATEDLLKAYTDIGYDVDKAAKMVDFTLKFNAGPEKELTRGAILNSYKSALINKTAAKDLLIKQDYTSDLADFYILMADYDEATKTQDLLFDNIKTQYLLNKMSTTNVTRQLNNMGLDSSRISALISNWGLEKYQYELLPSKTELTSFLLKGIINETQYRQTMSQHGYDAVSIQYYLAAIKTETTGTAKRPTKSELGRFLTKGIIQPTEYTTEMKDLGYSEKYITMYVNDLQ